MRVSRAGNVIWGSLDKAKVFPFASQARNFLHRHDEHGQVVQLVGGSSGGFRLILRADLSHNG